MPKKNLKVQKPKATKSTSRKNKINLADEAEKSNAEVEDLITDAILLDICPKHLVSALKKAKTPAARADLLYELDRGELKAARDAYNKLDAFAKKLNAWFVQEFQDDQRGVTGKLGRVEIKTKEVGAVEDWAKFYKHIAKKDEFDLLNKAVNQKAVKERWEQNKEVPGVTRFNKKVVSLTQAKGGK